MKEDIKKIIFLIIAIFLAILAVQFVLWLLPIILMIVIAYYLYNYLAKPKNKNPNIIIKPKNKNKKG